MITPAPIDPPQVQAELWKGFRGAIAWDVGSNVGQTVPYLLSQFSQVIAFEPAVESFEVLNATFGQVPSVTLMHAAVSRHDGEVRLSVVPDQIATGQLVSAGTHGVPVYAEGDDYDGPVRTVPCRSMDSLLSQFGPPDFVKVDVEGHEFEVLAGGAELISKFRPAFLIEFHNPELRADCQHLLESSGYAVEIVRHPHHAPESLYWHMHGWLRALPA